MAFTSAAEEIRDMHFHEFNEIESRVRRSS